MPLGKRVADDSQSSSVQPSAKKRRLDARDPAKIKAVKRLALPKTARAIRRDPRAPSLRGSRPSRAMGTGGFGSTPGPNNEEESIWVTRRTSFVAFLKRGTAAFTDRGISRLSIFALGAAIPMALRLGAAIRDALPGDAYHVHVKTGSHTVIDELEPVDQDEDLVYRDRTKSTIEVVIEKPH